MSKKITTNLDGRLKSRDIILPTKVSTVKAKVMASGPITSWQIDEETVKAVSDFIFGGSKITTDGDCSHEIKR